MSEPKLCPYRQHYGWTEDVQTKSGAYQMNGFDPCLQDKCAMWREAETIVQEQYIMVNRQVSPEIIRTDRYCGLAGKP